jgi:hypothetical protein
MTRRGLLRQGAVGAAITGALVAGLTPLVPSAAAEPSRASVDGQGAPDATFSVSIPGMPNASDGISDVEISPMVISQEGQGQGKASFTSVVVGGRPLEFEAWVEDWAAGKGQTKDATVVVIAGDGAPLRTWILRAMRPVGYEQSPYTTESHANETTLTVQIGHVEFK